MDLHEDIHRAIENYFDQNEFRRWLNAAIQNSRGVTFLLQKRKAQWADFDDWYLAWQNEARTDSVMSWGVTARNRVVKEEDLKTFSEARISVYGDRLREVEDVFVVPPSVTVEMILYGIMRASEDRAAKRTGKVRIQRRWVDSQLPEYELVAALREMYRGVALVVQRAHEASGVEQCDMPTFARECVTSVIDRDLDCLPRGDTLPSKLFDLATGEVSTIEYLAIERDEELIKIGLAKYGTPPGSSNDPIAHAMERLQLSKQFLEADGYSGPSLALFKGNDVRLHSLQFVEGEPRELKIAAAIDAHGAWQFDGAVFSSEMWMTSPGGRGSLLGVPASELLDSNYDFFDGSPAGNRDEALNVVAICADNRSRWLGLPFGKTAAGVIYGELVDDSTGAFIPNFLRPIWQRWPNVGKHPSTAKEDSE